MATSTVWAAAPSARLAVRLADQGLDRGGDLLTDAVGSVGPVTQPNDAVSLGGGLASTVCRAAQYRSAISMTGVPDRTSGTARYLCSTTYDHQGSGVRPVPARQPSIRWGRYWIFFSFRLTMRTRPFRSVAAKFAMYRLSSDPQVPGDLAGRVAAGEPLSCLQPQPPRRCCSAGVYPPRSANRMPRSYSGSQPPSRADLYQFILVSRPGNCRGQDRSAGRPPGDQPAVGGAR